MPDSLQYPVYEGVWTNWSDGRVFGATLTVPRNTGSLLIAFIALFVSIAGTQLWRVFCFAAHQVYSDPSTNPGDALYHQRQVILRNAAEPTVGILRFFQLLTLWGHNPRVKRPLRRIIPVLVCAFLIACGLAAASGFSAKITQGNEVLVDGRNCGIPVAGPTRVSELDGYIYSYYSEDQQIDSTYAQQCYSESGLSSSIGCNSFVRQKLPFSIVNNATCPFADSICRSRDSNILLDTGLIDTHTDLGVNSPVSERFKYRMTLHCAPLEWHNHTRIHNLSDTRSVIQYLYGANYRYDNGWNWTVEAFNDVNKDQNAIHNSVPGYSIDGYTVLWDINGTITNRAFEPIPELAITGSGYLNLLFLRTNGITYRKPINDPWFQATTILGKDHATGTPVYGSDTPASPMGCVTRHQYCNIQGKCSPLAADGGDEYTIRKIFPDEQFFLRAAWFNFGTQRSDLWRTIYNRNALNVGLGLTDNVIERPLADDYWKSEVSYWFSTMLATIQRSVVSAAAGPWDDSLNAYKTMPEGIEPGKVCNNQKIISPYHTSFSLFWLLFIAILGSIVIFLGTALPTIVAFLQKRRMANPYARLEWCTNDVLQLQRLAHEELGLGTWTRGTKSVPITQGNIKLGILDISNPEHPRLRAPDIKTEEAARIKSTSTDEDIGRSQTIVADSTGENDYRLSLIRNWEPLQL
ncbi:hypothetical protein F5Y04DRAFT_288225 [Hypomontagnella monticulosa]|nr:hypothetical protein F5Y04DRAFT_288225 [Hypomontagnella monticulosa]